MRLCRSFTSVVDLITRLLPRPLEPFDSSIPTVACTHTATANMTLGPLALRSFNSSVFAASSGSTTSSKDASAYDYTVIVVHVVLGALATMLLLPTGVMIPRYARGLTTARWWFPVHMGVQGLTVVIGVGALATAFWLGGAGGSSHQVRSSRSVKS